MLHIKRLHSNYRKQTEQSKVIVPNTRSLQRTKAINQKKADERAQETVACTSATTPLRLTANPAHMNHPTKFFTFSNIAQERRHKSKKWRREGTHIHSLVLTLKRHPKSIDSASQTRPQHVDAIRLHTKNWISIFSTDSNEFGTRLYSNIVLDFTLHATKSQLISRGLKFRVFGP